jgi:peptidylprolyl isomerase domain and WD repeat-containing protein 1
MASTDASVLGKREREEQEGNIIADGDVSKAASRPDAAVEDNDDDDDIGPMPLPAGAESKAVRKKRKGKHNIEFTRRIQG